MYVIFELRNQKERDHLGDLKIDRSIICKCIIKILYVRTFTGLNWLRIVTSGGLL
jgi:hypothetical protein